MAKKQPKLTPWFPASVKPVRRGVYQRDWPSGPAYAMWDGKNWRTSWGTVEYAANPIRSASGMQGQLSWRGFAEKPQ